MRNRLLIIFIVCTAGTALFIQTRKQNKRQYQQDYLNELNSLPEYARDFSTPEGAILCLEEAYRQRDIEAAVECKDFTTEAKLMLNKLDAREIADPNIIDQTAELLEFSFREYTEETWPDFNGLESYFTKRENYTDGIVSVTEVCRFTDGGFSRQRILVAKTKKGWRVLNPLEQ
ncbi:MAG TPA: hypothetical protein HPP87_11910 [Planctomycetes bacterium]|nr:hypothetical protein [Planctomycetota bacterium]